MNNFGVAVKGAIVREGQVLVLYKSDKGVLGDPDQNRRHDLPGGRVELGEAPIEALHREIFEETGLNVTIQSPVHVWHYFKPSEQFQLVGITFACVYLSGEVQLSEEHSEFEWLSRDELLQKKWPDNEEYIQALNMISEIE